MSIKYFRNNSRLMSYIYVHYNNVYYYIILKHAAGEIVVL